MAVYERTGANTSGEGSITVTGIFRQRVSCAYGAAFANRVLRNLGDQRHILRPRLGVKGLP